MVNMGAEPYMIAGTFNIVMAQRLARTINEKTKIKYNAKEEDPETYAFAVENMKQFMTDNKQTFALECKRRGITQEMLTDFQQ